MKRVSSHLKMRVLGAIESAPGSTIVARIRHVSGTGEVPQFLPGKEQ